MTTTVAEHQRALQDLLGAIRFSAGQSVSDDAQIVSAADALGRTLAADLRSDLQVPPADNSQMDGFAYRVQDLADLADGACAELPLGPVIAAGMTKQVLQAGTARPIMTGAAVPAGATAIIPVEETEQERFTQQTPPADRIRFTLAPHHRESGRFIRTAGSDTARGDVIARARQRLTPRLIGHLTSVGHDRIPVHPRLVAIVVSTGSELGTGTDQVRDANGPALTAALTELGITVASCLHVQDDPHALLTAVTSAVAATGAQLIISTGGVSAGAIEPIRQAAELGDPRLRLAFHRVAMQPGGPQGLGRLTLRADDVRGLGGAGTDTAASAADAAPGHEAAWVALPGNPVSALVSVEMFLRPALGVPARPRVRLPIRTQTGDAEPSPAGKLQVRRGRLQSDSTVRLVGGPGSHLLGALALSDALVLIPADATSIADRDIHEVILLS